MSKTRLSIGIDVPWTPDNISKVMWLDASDTGTIVSDMSGEVSNWSDKSGEGNNLLNYGSKPKTGINTLNGLNVLKFASDTLRGTTGGEPHLTGDASWFVVWRFISGVYLWTNWGRRNAININGGNYRFLTSGGSLYSTVSVDTGNFSLGTIEKNADGQSVYFSTNGGANEETVNGAFSNPEKSSGNGAYLGSYDGGNKLTGDVAELIVLDRIASLSDRQKIEGYLAHKWGQESNLPIAHPYKTLQPFQ